MTTITIDRALLEQALEALNWSKPVSITTARLAQHEKAINAIRAELAKPVEPADPLDWPLPCDIKIGGGTHSKGSSLRSLVRRMKALHEAAFPGQASITAEQQDANLERLRNPPSPTPAWHDAPTCDGLWLCNEGDDSPYRWTTHRVTLPISPLLVGEDERWYGPIPQDKEGEKS